MKLVYLNDETIPVTVWVYIRNGNGIVLGPKENAVFDVPVREDHVLFIKKWDNGFVLLTDISL